MRLIILYVTVGVALAAESSKCALEFGAQLNAYFGTYLFLTTSIRIFVEHKQVT